jgi:NitT/TauT family transport system ATP-binding protein
MQSNVFVQLQNVRLAYGEQTVLDGFSLDVRRGEVFGILGAIGSGKTRILRLIAGLEEPDQGTLEWDGSIKERPFGYVLQQDLLIPWLNVEENLRLCNPGIDLLKHPLAREMGLDGMWKKKPGQLSGGMRKKVNLARAFLNPSGLVLMDEPFGALDPVQKRELQALVLKLIHSTDSTAVMVTHDIQEALFACGRVGFLSSKSHRLVKIVDNPYRGRTDTVALLADGGYRALIQEALEFYEGERA